MRLSAPSVATEASERSLFFGVLLCATELFCPLHLGRSAWT